MKPILEGSWEGGTVDKVIDAFEDNPDARYEDDPVKRAAARSIDRKGIHIIFAGYFYESYEGSAFVLYSKGRKLYTVTGGHCSCNGLEGQWSPQETSWVALEKLFNEEGDYTMKRCSLKLPALINEHVKKGTA